MYLLDMDNYISTGILRKAADVNTIFFSKVILLVIIKSHGKHQVGKSHNYPTHRKPNLLGKNGIGRKKCKRYQSLVFSLNSIFKIKSNNYFPWK